MRIYTFNSKDKNHSHNLRRKTWRKRLTGKKFWTWVFRVAAGGILFFAVVFLYYAKDLPDPNKLLDRNVPESTKIYARDGSLLYEIHGEYKRTQVTLDQISPNLQHATIAIEDKNFYNEGGISVTGIIRSAFIDLLTLKKTQGASTITQQFVKNAILTDDKTWDRKIREAILAITIDAKFSKSQILQFYLNEIPYGRNAYGAEAAAETYFGIHATDLDVAQSAYLAALPQAPTYYNPSGPNRAALDARKNSVLVQMKDQGYITADQEKQAEAEKVQFSNITNSISAPHFVLWVQNYLAQKYGEQTLEEGGLQVYTTLDPNLQKIAEAVVKNDLTKETKTYRNNNAALVAIDPKTGQVMAMVGSKDYFGTPEPAGCVPGTTGANSCTFEPNFNAATSPRQPGSSFKPYVYATAFKPQFNYYPAYPLFDIVTDFGSYGNQEYIPHNYDGTTHGLVPMRQALAGSLNIPAVKTLALVGVDNAVQTAHDLGITSPLQNCGLSLVLGGCEITLLDHVAAYSTLANEGVKNPETPILKIVDKDGKILEQYQANPQTVLDPQAAYEVISIMTDNNARAFIFGSHSPLILPDRIVAAKTGTTNDFHDGWTIGFTPSLAAGVWTGNNNNEAIKQGADGVVVAAPIWHDFMAQALASSTPENFAVPAGIQKIAVDQQSGKLPTQYSPTTITDVFASYAIPTTYDDVHQNLAIDSTTGQPATSLTPPSQVVNRVYTVFHSEKPKDPNWENPVEAWAIQNGYGYPGYGNSLPSTTPGSATSTGNINLSILQPSDGAIISQLPLTVSVNASGPNSIARMDLLVDGQLITSLTSQPYIFSLVNSYNDGNHLIAARAVDSSGATAETSVSVQFMVNTPISMAVPNPGASLNFPQTLSAQSPYFYNQVTFYLESAAGSPKVIGVVTTNQHFGNYYTYSTSWAGSLPSGTYKIFAQTDSGVMTPKVTVTSP